MTRAFFITVFNFIVATIAAQIPSENDLYLFSVQKTPKNEFHIYDPRFLSAFNRGGYTNQPWFTPKGNLLVSVRRAGENQNDIWELSLSTKKYRRLTNTAVIEYSPRIHPDEEHLSFLQKVGEEPLDQQVYSVDLQTGEKESVSIGVKNVGYYTWISEGDLGLFRIDPAGNSLTYFDVSDGKSRRITTSVGRTLLSDKEGRLIYVHKFSDEYWYIKKYDPATSGMEIVTQTIGKNEDFALAQDGTYFMGNNHLLYYFNPARDKEWKLLSDLSAFGIKYISRMVISPDTKQLVLVGSNQKPQ